MNEILLDFFQLSLIVLALTTLALSYYFKKAPKDSMFLMLFVILGVSSGGLLNDMLMGQFFFIPVVFPFLIPLFYLMGPLLYLHYRNHYEEVHRSDYWHLFPAGLFFLDCLIYYTLYPEKISQLSSLETTYDFGATKSSLIFSGNFILVTYPILVLGYSSYLFLRHLSKKRNLRDSLFLLLGIVFLLCIALQDLVMAYHLNVRVLPFNLNVTRILLSLVGPIFLLYCLNIFKNTIVETLKTPSQAINLPEVMAIHTYVENLHLNENCILFKSGTQKIDFYSDSPYSAKEWNNYLLAHQCTFSEVKRLVRINRAAYLIENDYLNRFSVEALAEEVGYKSRGSFYAAFEAATGKKLSNYRDEISSD